MRGGRGVELSGERSDDGFVRLLIGPRKPDRRHVADAQFADDLLPLLGVLRDRSGENRVEHKTAGFHFAVVAADAVVVDDG